MGTLNNIFSLVFGINLIVVGLVAFISGIVSLIKRDSPVKKLTSVVYISAGSCSCLLWCCFMEKRVQYVTTSAPRS